MGPSPNRRDTLLTLYSAACAQNGNALFLKLRIIARSTLTRFASALAGHKTHAAVKAALDAWFHEVARASWRSSADVKKSYATASIVSAERVVFNIKGNSYRLLTTINYRRQIVFITWLGSHAEYDRIDARTVLYDD